MENCQRWRRGHYLCCGLQSQERKVGETYKLKSIFKCVHLANQTPLKKKRFCMKTCFKTEVQGNGLQLY